MVGEQLGRGALKEPMAKAGWPDVGTSRLWLHRGAINLVRFTAEASAAAIGEPGPLVLVALGRGRTKLVVT